MKVILKEIKCMFARALVIGISILFLTVSAPPYILMGENDPIIRRMYDKFDSLITNLKEWFSL